MFAFGILPDEIRAELLFGGECRLWSLDGRCLSRLFMSSSALTALYGEVRCPLMKLIKKLSHFLSNP